MNRRHRHSDSRSALAQALRQPLLTPQAAADASTVTVSRLAPQRYHADWLHQCWPNADRYPQVVRSLVHWHATIVRVVKPVCPSGGQPEQSLLARASAPGQTAASIPRCCVSLCQHPSACRYHRCLASGSRELALSASGGHRNWPARGILADLARTGAGPESRGPRQRAWPPAARCTAGLGRTQPGPTEHWHCQWLAS